MQVRMKRWIRRHQALSCTLRFVLQKEACGQFSICSTDGNRKQNKTKTGYALLFVEEPTQLLAKVKNPPGSSYL